MTDEEKRVVAESATVLDRVRRELERVGFRNPAGRLEPIIKSLDAMLNN